MICDSCEITRDHLTGAVVDGKFGQYCKLCLQNVRRMTTSGHAQYSRDRDKEDNAKDLLQPWDRAGKPSREFINSYPDEAQEMFSPQELHEHS